MMKIWNTEGIEENLIIGICNMNRISLDSYDTRPTAMTSYLRHYGWHFNRKILEFAVSKMTKNDVPIQMLTREKIDSLLKAYNIVLKNNQLYDYVYVANMCKEDFMGSSITDEEHLAKYIKDVIDDEDAYDGIVFNRWYADMCKKGVPIDWEDML